MRALLQIHFVDARLDGANNARVRERASAEVYSDDGDTGATRTGT